jgi:glycosyltransferase involved in cell wall biosynthesis
MIDPQEHSLARPERRGAAGLPQSPVLQVALSLSPGGTERLVIEIASRLAPELTRVICCLDEPGEWADSRLAGRGIAVTALHRRPGFRPSIGLRLAEIADRCRSRVLHCHHYSPFVYGCLAALRRPRIKVIFTEHGRLDDGPPSGKRRVANRALARIPAGIYAVSAELRRHVIAEGLPGDRVEIIHNGIDPGDRVTAADRRTARVLLGIPDTRFVIGTAARLDVVKDVDTLIAAVASLRATLGNVVLVIIGEGPERRRLEDLVCARGLWDSTRFLGYRHDIRSLLPGFDLFVNSSTSEGISLTIPTRLRTLCRRWRPRASAARAWAPRAGCASRTVSPSIA